ncbi:ubiquinone biosynthesis protein COQ4 homolog 2, mitochondrial-like isoform X2 [Ischnura elegans]|uniref:ubiquinone biosynthesis protein COQ4 homolog 2, mitochondrial-like isoform X2 n=1 Tax=Ischnura elegans TaxID=197161 RepID=UPI001ED8730E|nr:ubiquinone biosynthesis protein COQ4 homolog 2, mitochondrial-like isoform X2 [Ischnura elegans]
MFSKLTVTKIISAPSLTAFQFRSTKALLRASLFGFSKLSYRFLDGFTPNSESTGGMKNNYSKSEKESVYALRYFQASLFQKILLTGGSAYMSLLHTTKRPDMMAVLGEVTGNKARKKMYEEMLNDDEGLQILRDQPRINTSTTDFEALSRMPSGTLGKVYLDFLQSHKISPDKRPIVQFIEDPELAYVMQRFREIHDLIHVILNVPTNILGEVVVKWVEGIQTGLPVCLLAAVCGPLQLSPNSRDLLRIQ